MESLALGRAEGAADICGFIQTRAAPEKNIIRTDDVDYSTRTDFNIGAIGVLAILATLYTLFW